MSKLTLTWGDTAAAWAAHLRAAGRSAGTIKLRLSHLRRLARELDTAPGAVTADQITAWLGRPEWSGDTRRSHRASVAGFYGWLHSSGRLEANPAGALPSASSRRGRPRPAAETAITAALASADARDSLMIRCAAHAGMRACEIATLHSSRIFQDFTGWSVTVIGKGGKLRDIPLTKRLALDLRAAGDGWIFPGRLDGHLSAAYVSKRLSWALGPDITGHMLRHRFASAAYAAERDLRAVQELLGHTSPATTAIYTAIPDQALRRAVLAAAG